jgi:poly-gamma-glutamate capsule biosynthesis protein CapA/YwtB (metallophosphatase superfamily)
MTLRRHPPKGMNLMPDISTFNWEQGTWSAPGAGKEQITVCVAGDWAPIRRFRSLIETSPRTVYGDLLPAIQSADLSIVNLETPLSDRGAPVDKSGSVFKGEERHVSGLAAVPIDVVTLANNHVFDYGLDAFQDTLAVLERHNIQHIGAGLTEEEAARPLVLDINGVTIGIVNFSEGEDLTAAQGTAPGVMGWDLATVTQTIKTLKQQVDVVLAIGHGGIEYIPFPPPYVTHAFQQAAEAGADVVLGHHPHVPQGLSFHKGVPVCHSLGNFVFFQETDLKFRKLGYLVTVGFTRDGLVSLKLVPYRINGSGLQALQDQELDSFLVKFKEISLPLDDPRLLSDTWHGFLHYYGANGFFEEVSMIVEKMKIDPKKGAAMFRNRMTTLQHYHHWKALLTRMVDGTLASSPQWARRLTEEWMTAKLETH